MVKVVLLACMHLSCPGIFRSFQIVSGPIRGDEEGGCVRVILFQLQYILQNDIFIDRRIS